ncbi:hypothetical protein [Pseudomonas fluorescens]|uniref:Uncharacterized protein n=1 Tax=Pseudomonas fluorescens TaxID=294 RepID=A0A4Y9T9D6_PSEFL|nr:hypothetical protein [Pseudomonas fluorescens]TFW40904.1 hypothetical protein E4T65_23950 [Pseudomonas fluorescens]
MLVVDELQNVSDELERIGDALSSGITLAMFVEPLAAQAGALIIEAKELIEGSLSVLNKYSYPIDIAWAAGKVRGQGYPTAGCISEINALVQAAIRSIRRKTREASQAPTHSTVNDAPYVTLSRIEELERSSNQNFDLRKLVQLCRELNTCHQHNCHHAVAMLVRSIMDHVPPIFSFKTFTEVASNYGGGGKSFKSSMEHLQKSLRNIADSHLHTPIRSRESLPTASQVDFKAALDQLLGEIVRIA